MAQNKPASQGKYPLTVFFDGECPICNHEIGVMKWLNRRNRLDFIDFADSGYDANLTGLPRTELGHVIHARWADGSTIVGVDVFRAMWTAVGFGLLARLSRIAFVDRLLIKGYEWFAVHRLWLTGRNDESRIRQGETEDFNGASCERCSGLNEPRQEH